MSPRKIHFRFFDDTPASLRLPRDRQIVLDLQARGRGAGGAVTTDASSNTCVKTIRLQ